MKLTIYELELDNQAKGWERVSLQIDSTGVSVRLQLRNYLRYARLSNEQIEKLKYKLDEYLLEQSLKKEKP